MAHRRAHGRKPFQEASVARDVHGAVRLSVAAVALVLFVGAQLVPGAWLPQDAPGTDKQWHGALYFGYGLLLWWLLPTQPLSRAVIVLSLGLLTGVLLELLQDLVPGRNPDQADAVADMVGLAAACAGCLVGSQKP